MKIVVNRCYGGFSLSCNAIMRYAELKGITVYHDNDGICDNYYTIPVKEYKELHKKAEKTRDFSVTNGVYFTDRAIARDDPFLIQVVEELGSDANGRFSKLEVVKIPDDVNWEIDEYDGMEAIAEVHRRW